MLSQMCFCEVCKHRICRGKKSVAVDVGLSILCITTCVSGLLCVTESACS